MKLGWLWLSILKTTASPSPMSITPAFSPGPWITQGALVGSVRRWMREDLYEQCSFHIAEKMPSSVKLGVRPMSVSMRAYSSGLRPWAATSAGVIVGSLEAPPEFFVLRATGPVALRTGTFLEVLAMSPKWIAAARTAILAGDGSTVSCAVSWLA